MHGRTSPFHIFVTVALSGRLPAAWGSWLVDTLTWRITSVGRPRHLRPSCGSARQRSPGYPGTGSRPAPGCHPQPTEESLAMCSTSSSMVLPPLRAGSLICWQMSPSDLPSHAISIGARCQAGLPGMLFKVSDWSTMSDIGRAMAGVAHHSRHAHAAIAAQYWRLVLDASTCSEAGCLPPDGSSRIADAG